MTTEVGQFIADLDAGVLEQKLSATLSEVAAAVVDNDKQGSVTLTLTLKRIGNSYQVAIDHKLAYTRPTKRGKVSEENTTQTPMYVGTRGKLTLFPEGQDQLFDKQGNVNNKNREETR